MLTLSNAVAAIATEDMILVIVGLCFLPALIWMLVSSVKVNSVFRRYSKVKSRSNMTGAEVARKILAEAGLYNVRIEPCKGNLTDHYDPRSDTVFLSESTFSSTSVAAHGVAAHEVGHAMQYASSYAPVKMRTALVPILSFSSKFTFPLLMFSIILEIFIGFNMVSNALLAVSIAIYGLYTLFSLITLPVEYNASSRAKKMLLKCGILDSEEVGYTSKVLGAAAQTYLASFVFSFLQFLRLLSLLLIRRRD